MRLKILNFTFFNPDIPTGQLYFFKGSVNTPETPPAMQSLTYSGCSIVNLFANFPDAENPLIINLSSNKILQLMVQSNDDQVKKQVADLINDKDYHERIQDMFASKDDRILDNDREKALENSYMSLPQDFMRANDITPEEMQRMQKTMWLLDKAGRFKA